MVILRACAKQGVRVNHAIDGTAVITIAVLLGQ